jgi:hypothetical protein
MKAHAICLVRFVERLSQSCVTNPARQIPKVPPKRNVPGRLGAPFVSAQTVHDLDWIVGYYVDASNVAHGFVARR